MKIKYLLLIITISVFSIPSKASEITISLEQKVNSSSVIAIIQIEIIELGKIQKRNGYFSKTQEIKITAKLIKSILGKTKRNISFTCQASSFSDGKINQFSTAGFSSFDIKKGNQYIAYLKKQSDNFLLIFDSNQALEKIDKANKQVTDIGQTTKKVPLKEKINKLIALVKAKDNK